MRYLTIVASLIFPLTAFALSCGSLSPKSYAQHVNVAVIVVTDAQLRDSGLLRETVARYRVEEVLKGTTSKSGEIVFPLDGEDWPIHINVGSKYIVPIVNDSISWSACSATAYGYRRCLVYGIKKLIHSEQPIDENCELQFLRQEVIVKSRGEFHPINVLRMSEDELRAYKANNDDR